MHTPWASDRSPVSSGGEYIDERLSSASDVDEIKCELQVPHCDWTAIWYLGFEKIPEIELSTPHGRDAKG
jgi:hypothetical protein